MRVAIFEDNNEHSQMITAAIETWARSKNKEIALFVYGSVFETAELSMFDCIFLDVELPGMSGLEFAQEIRQNGIDIPIVFISSHTEYSLDGYEVEALRFLDKNDPSFNRKFTECMDRVSFEINNSINAYYRIMTERKLVSLPMKEIVYFEVVNHDLHIFTMMGAFTERKPISQLKNELPNQFVQIGKSIVINVLQVVQVTKSHVVLCNGVKLPVAPKYSGNLFAAYTGMM